MPLNVASGTTGLRGSKGKMGRGGRGAVYRQDSSTPFPWYVLSRKRE